MQVDRWADGERDRLIDQDNPGFWGCIPAPPFRLPPGLGKSRFQGTCLPSPGLGQGWVGPGLGFPLGHGWADMSPETWIDLQIITGVEEA